MKGKKTKPRNSDLKTNLSVAGRPLCLLMNALLQSDLEAVLLYPDLSYILGIEILL